MARQSKTLKSELDFTKTKADRVTVRIICFLGSPGFLTGCVLVFGSWITWNLWPRLHHFDPFPFPLLEMGVSIFAIILSVTVLINQNRQRRIENIQQDIEFEINVRAEKEVTRLLVLVHDIHQKLGLSNAEFDRELEEMKAETDLEKIHRAVAPKHND